MGTCIVTSPSSPQRPYFKIYSSNQAVFFLISLIFIQEASISLSWPTVDRQSVVRGCCSQLPKYLLPYIIFRIISYYVLREQAGTLAPPKSDIHKVRYNCNPKTLNQLSTVLEEGVVSQAAVFASSRNATRSIAWRDKNDCMRDQREVGIVLGTYMRKKWFLLYISSFFSSLPPSVLPYLCTSFVYFPEQCTMLWHEKQLLNVFDM